MFIAAILHLPIIQPALNINSSVYDIVQLDTVQLLPFFIPGILLQHTKEPWLKPALVQVFS